MMVAGLLGDLYGNGRVDGKDLRLVQALVTDGPVNLNSVVGADRNFDGVISRKDLVGLPGSSSKALASGLVRDYNGDGRVDLRDFDLIRRIASLGPVRLSDLFHGDIYREGQISRGDLALIEAGLTQTARPLSVQVGVDSTAGSNTIFRNFGVVQGRTSAGALVHLGQGAGTGFDQSRFASSDGSFSFVVGLGMGLNVIRVEAVRVGSRPASTVIVVDRVAAPPTVTVESPSAGQVSRHLPTIVGQVVDLASPVGPLFARVDGAPVIPVALDASGRFSVPIALATDGSTDGIHQVVLVAGAYSGDFSSPVVVPFGLDTRSPIVTITSPTPGQVVPGDLSILGTATDATSGVAALEARIDEGTPFPVAIDGSGNFSIPTVFPTDGPHSVILVALDRAGNPSAIARDDFTVSGTGTLTPPTAVRLAPGSDSGASPTDGITNVTSPTILVDATPGATVQLFQDGAAVGRSVASGGEASIGSGPLADGVHRFFATTVDADGRSSTASPTLVVTIKTTRPATPTLGLAAESMTDPTNPLSTSSSLVTLVGQADPNEDVTLEPLGVSTMTDDTGTFRFASVPLILGANPFTAEVVDIAGNVASGSISILRTVAANPNNAVIVWNRVTLAAIQADDTDPVVAARALGMVQSAVFDAVNAVEGKTGHDVTILAPAGSSADAAVASAADRVLASLYPGQAASFGAALATSLGSVADGASRTDGIVAGQAVADAIIAERANDGAHLFEDFTPQSSPGSWVPTAPAYAAALDPQYAHLTPFAMTSDSQFRPAGPPALTSAQYAAEVQQVEAIGRSNSTTRTADQTQIARFWNDGAGSFTPSGHWNQIAETVAVAAGAGLTVDARLFAMLDVAEADAAIVAWDAKYLDQRWRPITAIREAGQVPGTASLLDPTWSPLLVTPAFPGYVSGHSTFSGAADAILTSVFGSDVSFQATAVNLPGVTRSYTSFAQAANEAGISRVYGGIHFLSDDLDGLSAGRALGQYVAGLYSGSSTLPPRIIVTSPSANRVSQTDPTVTGRVLASPSGVASLTAEVDGGSAFSIPFDPATGNFSVPIPLATDGSADGLHTIVLAATDHVDNMAVPVNLSFTLDTLAPIITLGSPAIGGLLSSGLPLSGIADPTGSSLVQLRYAFDGGSLTPVAFNVLDGTFSQALDFSRLAVGGHTLDVSATDAAGNTSTVTVPVTLAQQTPLAVSEIAPSDGSVDVGVTYRPRVTFSRPIDSSTLNSTDFYATSGGQVLPATIAPSDDGTSAWLFLAGPMPGGSIVQLVLDGSKIRARDGSLLGSGLVSKTSFSTVSVASVAGTSISGVIADPGPDLFPNTLDDVSNGPDGVLMTGDDVYKLPIAGATVAVLGRPDLSVLTDAKGQFHLDGIPVGDVKLSINGRTATNAPTGIYFPEMVLDLTIKPGRANTVMGSMGTPAQQASQAPIRGVYLPRVRTSILTNLDPSAASTITVPATSAPDLTDEQRAAISAQIPAGSAIGFDGKRMANAQVGITVVPPMLVAEMLPPGLLQHAFDLSMQAPNIAAFSDPVPVTLPNIFNLAPGEKMDLLSFDHTTGRLVIQGTLTVAPDGQSATTDPGSGLLHPGWFGVFAGSKTQLCMKSASSPNGPDPTVTQTDIDALKSQFFKDDKGTFTLSFANSQTDPTGKKLQVTLKIDGPSADFLDGLEPYKNHALLLCPGQSMTIPVKLKAKLNPNDIKKVEQDILYGIQIHIMAAPQGNPGKKLIDKNVYVYRYVDAADDKHDDGTLEFSPTLIDGSGGVTRPRQMTDMVGKSAMPTLNIKDMTNFTVEGKAGQQYPTFDPTGDPNVARSGLTTPLEIKAPDGKTVGMLTLLGNGSPVIHINFNKVGLLNILQEIANGTAPAGTVEYVQITPNERAMLASPGIRSDIANQVENGVKSDYSQFSKGIQVVDETGPNTIQIVWETLPLPDYEYGKTPRNINFIRDATLGALYKNRANYSVAVQNFLLSKQLYQLTNTSYVRPAAHLENNIGGQPLELNEQQFINALIDTVAHESGHALSAEHTAQAKTVTVSTPAQQQVTVSGGKPTDRFILSFLGAPTASLPVGATAQQVQDALSQLLTIGQNNLIVTLISPGNYLVTFSNHLPPDAGDLATFGKLAFVDVPDLVAISSGSLSVGVKTVVRGHSEYGNVFIPPNGLADIMYGGFLDLTGKQRFLPGLTNDLLKLSLRLDWTKDEAQNTLDLEIKHQNALYLGLGSDPTTPDSGDEPVIEGPHLALVSVNQDVAGGTVLFGSVNAGDQSIANIDLVNYGTQAVILNQVQVFDPSSSFSTPAITPGTSIEPGQSLRVPLRFAPNSFGPLSAHLEISTNDPDLPTDFVLSGTGQSQSGYLQVSVPNNNLGGQTIGAGPVVSSGVISIQNPGGEPLTITAVNVSRGVGEFSVGGLPVGFGPRHPLVIQPGGFYSLDVSFLPDAVGLRPGRIEIVSDDPLSPVFHQAVIGTGLAASGAVAVEANDYVAIQTTDVPGAPIFRQRTDDSGNWSFVLPPNTPFQFTIFDPITGLVAEGGGLSSDYGQVTMIASPVFQASTGDDTDGDGLPDDVEFATGTSTTNVDTAGFGLGDFATVEEGLDALGDQASTTGVIAGLPLLGQARRLVVEGSPSDPQGQTAYVATGAYGLAVVDISRYGKPIALGQVELPGVSVDLAVDPALNLVAVASGPGGLNIVDVSDPTTPRLAQSVAVAGANSVVIADGVAYVASGSSVVAVDVASGGVLQSLDLGAGSLVDFAVDGSFLYATDGSSDLIVVDLGGPAIRARGSLKLPSQGGRLSVGDGVAYIATTGFGQGLETVDVSDPDHPRLLSTNGTSAGVAGYGVGPNGSGLALVAGSFTSGTVSTPSVGVLKVSDPANPAFLFSFNLPSQPSDVAVAEGLGIVADGPAGLEFVAFRPFDTKGQPPTASISSPAIDADPNAPGVQVFEGKPISIQVVAGDDIQVRNVELLVNGRVVANSVTFPFGLSTQAPLLSTGQSSITVRVRATDTGGNVTFSNLLTFGVIADPTSPRVASMNPSPNSITRDAVRSVELSFDKPLDPSSGTPSSFALVGAGIDGVIGTSDDVSEPIRSAILSSNGDRLTLLLAGNLPVGAYRLTASSGMLRDLTGHALDGEFSGAFPTGNGVSGGDFAAGFQILASAPFGFDAFPARRFTNEPTISGLRQGANYVSPILAVDLTGSGRKDIVRPLNETLLDPDTNTRNPFNAVSVTYALPGGGYGTPTAFPVGDHPVQVVAGDLNGDGQSDLVVLDDPGLNNSNTPRNFELSVLIARNGTFQGEQRINVNLPMGAPGDMILGDFLGKGHLDLAVLIPANPGNGTDSLDARLALFPGNGDGSFGAPIVTTLDPGNSLVGEQNLAAAVLTRNGRLDLVTNLHILQNNGDGAFTASSLPGLPSFSFGAAFLAVADFTGSGVPEIVYGTNFGAGDITATILRGPGDGTYQVVSTFEIPIPSAQAGDSGGIHPVVADLNGDGKLDLVIPGAGVSGAGDVAVLLNPGDGSFGPSRVLPVFDSGSLSVAVADAYGTGHLDLLIGQGPGSTLSLATVVLTGDGNGTFDAPLLNAANPDNANIGNIREVARTIGDINGDGIPDVVRLVDLDFTVTNPVAVFQVALGLGDGNFGAFVTASNLPLDPNAGEVLTIGDLDGHGRMGLVVASEEIGGSVEILIGNRDGTLGNPITLDNTHPIFNVFLIDANHDGKLDYLAETNDGLVVRLGQGDGTFGPEVISSPSQTGLIDAPIAFGDLNGDGDPDIVTFSAIGFGILGRGDGSFARASTAGFEGGVGAIALSDINGDGKLDAVGYDFAGSLMEFPGHGDGTFGPSLSIPSALPNVSDVQAADLNGDGLIDLVLANRGEIDILLNIGDGTFQPAIAFDTPGLSGAQSFRILDLNHDGLLDILAVDTILLRKKPFSATS